MPTPILRALLLIAVCFPATALPHGIPPQTLSINTRAGVEGDLIVGSTFGGILTHDRGASWHLVCEEAIGYGSGLPAAWWLSSSGAIFAGSFKGLFVARSGGCQWQNIPDFDLQGCVDVKGQGSTLLAVQGKYSMDDDNRILRSTDDGLTWTASTESSKVLFYSSVRISPSDPQRVYVGAWWFQPDTSMLLRSDDNGQTFTRVDLSTALPSAGPFYVLGVHPTKSEVVFATVTRETDPRGGWLLRSTDSGATFTPVITTTEVFNSLAFGTDPAVVYAASGNQLFRSTDEGLTFAALPSPHKYACVAASGAHVYACGLQELDGWEVGQGPGETFTPLLRWQGIAGPLDCPAASTVTTLCGPLWPVVQASFPAERSDAGVTDGGVDPPPKPKGCGCATLDGPLAAVVFLRRRRRAC